MAIDPSIINPANVFLQQSPVATGLQGLQSTLNVQDALRGQREAQMKERTQAAGVISSVVGDRDLAAVQAEFPQIVSTLQSFGLPLEETDLQNTPENAQKLLNLSNAFRQKTLQARGSGVTRQTGAGDLFVEQVGTEVVDGKEVPVFQNFRQIPTSGPGGIGVEKIEVGSTFREGEANPLIAARVQQAGLSRRAQVVEGEAGAQAVSKTKSEREKEELLVKAQAEQALEASKAAFDQGAAIDSQISTLDEVISEIDAGADTGAIANLFPSFSESTVSLENAAKRMGLGVISSTTFGALSAPELQLAMETALPTNLDEDKLRAWAVKKQAALRKLQDQVELAGIHFAEGGTRAEWVKKQRAIRKQRESGGSESGGSARDKLIKLREEQKGQF